MKNKLNMNNIKYCKYIPIPISQDISRYLDKHKYAGKTFANVKLENKNPFYRLKRGEVLESTNDSCLLEIEIVNRVSDNGYSTLMAVVYPYGYEKIWFKKDELENFETYDENGNIQ